MEAQILKTETRTAKGTKSSRNIRSEGKIPAILYGHGEANVLLSIGAHDLDVILHRGVRVLELDIAGKNETAMIKEVQYDAMGDEPVHVDFTRVAAHEKIRLKVPVELVGTSVGVTAGGILDHPVSDLEIECLPTNIPESIKVQVKTLEIGGMITVGDLKVPEGITILTDKSQIVATVHPPAKEEAAAEAVAEAPGPMEPEVIGAKEREEAAARKAEAEKGDKGGKPEKEKE